MAENKYLNLNGLQYYTRKLDEKKADIESPALTGTPTINDSLILTNSNSVRVIDGSKLILDEYLTSKNIIGQLYYRKKYTISDEDVIKDACDCFKNDSNIIEVCNSLNIYFKIPTNDFYNNELFFKANNIQVNNRLVKLTCYDISDEPSQKIYRIALNLNEDASSIVKIAITQDTFSDDIYTRVSKSKKYFINLDILNLEEEAVIETKIEGVHDFLSYSTTDSSKIKSVISSMQEFNLHDESYVPAIKELYDCYYRNLPFIIMNDSFITTTNMKYIQSEGKMYITFSLNEVISCDEDEVSYLNQDAIIIFSINEGSKTLTINIDRYTGPTNIRLENKADLDSPDFTGTPTAPTPPTLNNSTRVATTEFVYKAMENNSGGLIAGDGIKIEDGVISVVEDDDGFGPDDFQKAMLQYFDAVGDKDSTMKPYCQKMRYSILNMEEFGKLGSGLFIHWGIYSVPAGVYTGEKQPGATVTATTTNYNAEWAMRDLGIPKDVYKAYENQFTGEHFDAEAICEMASNLGMKYIIITTKHHEGFCLAPTEHNTGWDIRTAACRNTIIEELAEACKKYKLKLCFYYSQYWDWMAEGGFGLNKNRNGQWSTTDPYTQAQHVEYCNKAIAQINELIEKYHPYVLWYDPGENVGTTYRDMFRAAEKEKYINVITNDRLGYNREYGDFGTGERTIYLRSLPYGESCFTLNNTWGYSTNNETSSIYYSLETLLKQFMLYTISYGQNCVLNVGPKPDGSLPDLTQTRLAQLQSFITNYANGGFYDYKRMTTSCRPKWGYMIAQPNNKVMCYVIMPSNKNYQNIILDGVDTTLLKADGVHILTPGTNASYTILDDDRIQINNLALDSDSKVGVVELEYTNEPIKLDFVTAQNHELISSRVFPVVGATYDFNKHCHYGNQSNTFNLNTRVKWIDESQECGIKLDYTYNTDNRSITTTITVTDEADSAKTQTFTFGENDLITATRFHFEKGHTYKIHYSTVGSIAEKFYFNGFTIEKNDVEHVTGVTVSPTSIDLPKGGTAQLTATVTPVYADDVSVTWESDNEAIATVSSAGFVTAGNQLGVANITVTSTDGSYAATCVVTVKDIGVTGVELEADAINMYQAETREIHYTITPENAGNQLVSWSSNNASVHVDNGIVSVEPDAAGTAIITITTEDGNYTDTCEITIVPETYDYIFQADSLPGSDAQGEDTGITLFDDEHTNWTILSYAQNSVNAGQSDNNATLYQIVVNASPWTGMRVDADNNNYPRTSATYSPLIPRFVGNSSGCDVYVNPITGVGQSGKPNVNPTGMMHPICFSRDGDTYKYSHDGVCWTTIENIGQSQINRLKTCPLTIGFDYKRSSGTMTTTKYRKLITDSPCCVAIKYESEYPFWKLYNQYDEGRTLGEIVE